MGRSNLLYGLERKIGTLMGEEIAKREEIERVEKLAETLPVLRDRLWEVQTLISATEALLKEIKPGWKRDTIDPIRPFVHQIPIKLGEAGRKGLEVLRDSRKWMTTREIATEVLHREGIFDANTATQERVRNTIGNHLSKRRDKVVESDGKWPQSWRVVRTSVQSRS
jgi:hypothetical protein